MGTEVPDPFSFVLGLDIAEPTPLVGVEELTGFGRV